MSDRILEGSNSVLVRTLTDAAATLLTKSGQLDEFITLFRTTMMAQPEVLRNAKYARHMAEVIERLTLRAAVNGTKQDPTVFEFKSDDFTDLLKLIDPPKAPDEDVPLSDEPGTLDEALNGTRTRNADPFYETMEKYVQEYARTREHPYVRAFNLEPGKGGFRWAVVGTCVGKSRKNPRAEFNANCTTQNFRKIKDVSEDILVHRNGRPMTVCHEAEDGSRYFLWLLHHKPGLELRFWINVNEPGKPRADIESGNVRVRLTDDAQGWRRV